MKLGWSVIPLCLSLLAYCAAVCTDIVYVGTIDGQLAISKYGGEIWRTVLSDVGYVYAINAHGGNVYAGTQRGLAVSHDSGASWSMKTLRTNATCDSSVISVYVNGENHVYALTGGNFGCPRIAVSADNGDTWPINFPLPNPPFASNAENIYVDGPRIYVASFGGLGFSDDMGTTWTLKDQASGLGSNLVQCVIGNGQSIYAGLASGGGAVSVSKDGGVTWKTVYTATRTGLQRDIVWSMYLLDDTLYVATTTGGLSWSNDFSSWTTKTTANGLPSNVTFTIIGSGNKLYLGTDKGLSISSSRGLTWSTITTQYGLPSNYIYSTFVQCV